MREKKGNDRIREFVAGSSQWWCGASRWDAFWLSDVMDAFNKFEYMAELCDLELFKDLFDLLFTASQENICRRIPVLDTLFVLWVNQFYGE